MAIEKQMRTQFLPSPARRLLLVWVVAVTLCTASALAWLAGAVAAPASGPDLTVEIQVIPAVPNPGEPAVVRMIFRNRGTTNSASATFYFYVDPTQRPPVQGTAPAYFSGVPVLAPGGSFQFDRNVTFNTIGCDHAVYA